MTQPFTGCFLIGATGEGVTKNSEALLGSVSDNPYDVRTFMKVVRASGQLTHIGTELTSTTDHTLEERGYFARLGETTRGVNEAGLAFTCAMVIENDSQAKPNKGTPFADITESIMKNCQSVDEAVEAFSSQKAIHPAYSVLLADANGELAHIEVGSYGVVVNERYSSKNPGVALAVNCYLSQSLIQYNAPHTLVTDKENNNITRYNQGKSLANSFLGEIDVAALKTLLSDHVNGDRNPMDNPMLEAWGYSICNHGTRKKESFLKENLPWGTVSAEILQPARKKLWYAYGWPCGQKPEYGDQIFQENSWGKFAPFGFSGENTTEESGRLTTPTGEITPLGQRYL